MVCKIYGPGKPTRKRPEAVARVRVPILSSFLQEVTIMDNIVQIVAQLGFPIAMCLLMFWYVTKKDESHKEEIDKMSEAVNNNTLVMQKLIDKLGDVK